MLGGMGGMNPKKMAGLMKKMGIAQEEVSADRVIIEKNDGGKIVIENPSVQRIKMQGQESWQIVGDAKEEEEKVRDEDVKLVAEKTGKSEDEARKALEDVDGEVAEAIIKLSS